MAVEQGMKNPNGILGTISFLIPFIGIIIGIVFLLKNTIEDKQTGKICLIASLFGIIIGIVFIVGCPLLLVGTLSTITSELEETVTEQIDGTIRKSASPQVALHLSGQGQQASKKFKLFRGLRVFRMECHEAGYFSVVLMDDAGNYIGLLASNVGSFSGSKAIQINQAGMYLLDISADGAWTVDIE